MELIARIHAFARDRVCGSLVESHQACAFKRRLGREMQRVEDGGRYVDETRWLGGLRRIRRSTLGPVNHQRNMQRAFIRKVAVTGFTMVPKTLAVVGQQHDERPLPPAVLLQGLPEAAEDPVDVQNLRIVAGGCRQGRAGRLVQSVRSVQVEEMNEDKCGLAFVGREPLGCGAQNERAVAPDARGVRAFGAGGGRAEGTVVVVESAVEPGTAAKQAASDEGGRLVSVGLENGGQGYGPGGNDFAIFLDAVLKRICGGEQRGVRGQRERNLCIDVREQRALLGEGVDVRRGNGAVSVGAQMVGAEGVDGDDDDRGLSRGSYAYDGGAPNHTDQPPGHRL